MCALYRELGAVDRQRKLLPVGIILEIDLRKQVVHASGALAWSVTAVVSPHRRGVFDESWTVPSAPSRRACSLLPMARSQARSD